MGCGGSKDPEPAPAKKVGREVRRNKGDGELQAVGPSDSGNPLVVPATPSGRVTEGTHEPTQVSAQPQDTDNDPNQQSGEPPQPQQSRGQRTKDVVRSTCDSDADDERTGPPTKGGATTGGGGAAAHFADGGPPVARVVSPSTGTKLLSAFAFGDNTDAKTLAECGDDAAGDVMSEAQMRKRGSRVRREGVSAEPILPGEAETFTPRVVPKSDEVFEKIRTLVERNPLFRALEADELATVIGAMEEETFAHGDVILREGELSTNKFYFIVDGAVSITRRGEFVCAFTAGNTFGEMELMYLSTCAATVACSSAHLVTYSLDASTYRHIVMFVSIRKRRQYKQLLGNVAFLSNMSEYDAMQLADALEAVVFAPGEQLLSFGEKSDWMYLLVSGGVEVIGRDEETGGRVEVCTFGAGDTVGELEFINTHPAVADVIATEETKACRLHRDHFEMCMGPVVDFLKQNALSKKYSYYNSVVTDDEGTGHKLAHFRFGDDGGVSDDASGVTTTSAGDTPFCAFSDDGGGARPHGGAVSPDAATELGSFDTPTPSSARAGAAGEAFSSPSTANDAEAAAALKARKRAPRRVGVSDEVMEDDDEWAPPVVPKSDEEKQMLVGVLQTNLLLRGLEGHDLDVVVMAMEKKRFAQGALILEQGGEGGSHYFVVTSGVVEIIKKGELVCTFGENEGFGEMELMYIQPCVATVRARTDVDTWALDRGTYKRVVMAIATKRRLLYTELLGGVEFLENMSEFEKGLLADALTPTSFEPGSCIIRRGERNEWMHIIVDGTVEVFGVDEESEKGEGRRKHVCFLERGACVGELEFLNQHPAVADCIAKTRVRTCTLHRDHFEMCLGPIMDVLRKTVRQEKYAYYNEQLGEIALGVAPSGAAQSNSDGAAAARRPRRARAKAVSAEATTSEALDDYDPPLVPKTREQLETLQRVVRRCPLFGALQAQDRAIIIGALEIVKLSRGDTIVREGEVREDNYWYIVSEGTVEMTASGDGGDPPTATTFESGSSFGELELMYTTPALATTTVISTTATLFRLDRRTYQKIVMKVSRERRALYRELLSGIQFLSRLSESDQLQLADALSPVHFAPAEAMIRVGERNEFMYIIVDGVVEVFGKDASKVCDLRRGEMVGELEFLHKHAAVADCIAKTHVQAVRLHRDHFEMCLGKVSDFIEATLLQPKYSYYNARRASMQAHALASAEEEE